MDKNGMPWYTLVMTLLALHHVQLAMPKGGESDARAFYCGVLGLTERPKPKALTARGGVWFQNGDLRLHLGVEADFRPAGKAHPAILVDNLEALVSRLAGAGTKVTPDDLLPGYSRIYVRDPFGNRIELMQPLPG